ACVFAPRTLEMTLQFAYIIVRKDTQDGATQLCAIDQLGMAALVEHDNVILRGQRGDCAQRCSVTAAEAERSLSRFPLCQHVFQANMRRLRTANQPRSTCADTEFVDGRDCRFSQSRIVCETEIIVRRKVYEPSARDFYLRPLRTRDFAKMPV